MFKHNTVNASASTTRIPVTAMVSFSWLCRLYDHLPGLCATGTKEIFSGDSHTALQNQIIQTNPCGSSNNAGGRTLQGTEGAEEVLRQIHYVCGLPATYYLPFGGAPSLREINITPGPIVLPATTGNGTSFECHFNFNPQRASALTPPNGLVFPPQTDTSEVPASGTACSGSVYPPSYNNTWAMQPDTSALGPEAQAVAPQMNTVTPCVVCCNDRGWASVGAAACPIAPAPGPTPKMKVRPLRTASTNPPRDAEKRSHRICQKTRDPRAVGYKRPSTPRRVPLSRAQTAKSPPVPYEKDINILSSRLLSERAHPATVGVLCTQVFNNGVTERALKAKFIHMGQSANNSSVKRKYLLLLEHRSNEYYCLLCPQDRPVRYKNPQDSLRHLRKDHFGLALICRCGW